MFPKIQKSRKACWPRFWWLAPAWAWASRSHGALPWLQQSCLERCEASSRTAFNLPPDPSLLQPSDYTAYWATQHTKYPPTPPPFTSWHSSLSVVTPLCKGLPCWMYQEYSSSFSLLFSPPPLISSTFVIICFLSLGCLWDDCVVIFQWASIWKSWTSWEVPANNSYWFTIL